MEMQPALTRNRLYLLIGYVIVAIIPGYGIFKFIIGEMDIVSWILASLVISLYVVLIFVLEKNYRKNKGLYDDF